MVGNSLESLLAWMKDESRMLGWDSIIALEGRQLNLGLQQDHIFRLAQDNDLGDFDVAFDVPQTDITHYLSGVKLAAPMLSFDEASLASTSLNLNMALVGGALIMVQTRDGQKEIIRVSRFDPIDGSKLSLDLPTGTDSRAVLLDLAKSENVLLHVFHTAEQQREAGRHFLARFKELNDARRVFTFGTFPDGGNPLLLTRTVEVRTQKRDPMASAPHAGALLLFVGMVDGRQGDYPGDSSGFRYLIPDSEGQKTWSGTALFSGALIHRAAFGHAVLQLLEDAQFERVTDDAGMLKKLVAKTGALPGAAGNYENLEYRFESEAFSLPATGGSLPLTVEFDEEQATQHWQATFALSFRYRPVRGTTWQNHTATFNVHLEHEFHFSADESSVLGMEGQLFIPYEHTQEVSYVSGLPGTIAPELLQQINDFVARTVKRVILERFSNTLTATSTNDFLPAFDIVGQSRFEQTDVALPLDQAVFGKLRSSASSFSIVYPHALVAAGKTLQLSTEPANANLTWVAESLPGSSSDAGSINDQGLYQAPPRHALEGSFNRVLVIATDKNTRERAVTLITVLSHSITVNPQIQTCFHGERVELSAGQIGTGKLNWSIKNPVPGESGTVVVSEQPAGDHTYIAGPQVTNKTYVLDEIEVTDPVTSQAASAYVLVLQKDPVVSIRPVQNPSLPEGQIQLQAIFDAEPISGTWSLPLGGPGKIDESGLYREDPTAKEQFVLIFVSVEVLGRQLQSHIILPMPLTRYPSVLKALTE